MAVSFLLMTPFSVSADAIALPRNDFFQEHYDQLVLLGRSFVVNGTGGSVPVKDEPEAKSDITRLENGEVVYIEYSCLYGEEYWGLIDTYRFSGWVALSQLLVNYDYVAFGEEHPGELYTYTGSYDEIKKAGAVIAWPWPGADAPLWTIENLNTANFWVSLAYEDAQGREWGFVPYLYGSRNIWVCLDEPLNSDIPAFNPTHGPGAVGTGYGARGYQETRKQNAGTHYHFGGSPHHRHSGADESITEARQGGAGPCLSVFFWLFRLLPC